MPPSEGCRVPIQSDADPIKARPRLVWAGFIAMCVGMFMAILDVQVVATSLPSIQSALDIDPDQMSWIQTAYLIAEVIAIPLTGFLTRVLTMRWLFVVSLAVFVIASAGCAASISFGQLVGWRVLQGFAGGTLIPSVFSAVFLLFPDNRQALATTIAGVLAVLAPTVGPIVGGWLTESYSWHWLFLINVIPGILAAGVAARSLPRERTSVAPIKGFDAPGLASMATALICLEIGLKEAPTSGWLSLTSGGLFVVASISAAFFIWRSLRIASPLVELRNFEDRNFLIGSALSFVLGIGLFGSVYLMPVFLAFVRGHNSLEIGMTMLVTGIAQLFTAPIAVALEKRMDPRLLSAAGFTLFAVGIGASAFQDPTSLRCDVLASGGERSLHHVLPFTPHQASTRQPFSGPRPRRQRTIQPHAQPWRRDRYRADRHRNLHPIGTARSEDLERSGERKSLSCAIRRRTDRHDSGP